MFKRLDPKTRVLILKGFAGLMIIQQIRMTTAFMQLEKRYHEVRADAEFNLKTVQSFAQHCSDAMAVEILQKVYEDVQFEYIVQNAEL